MRTEQAYICEFQTWDLVWLAFWYFFLSYMFLYRSRELVLPTFFFFSPVSSIEQGDCGHLRLTICVDYKRGADGLCGCIYACICISTSWKGHKCYLYSYTLNIQFSGSAHSMSSDLVVVKVACDTSLCWKPIDNSQSEQISQFHRNIENSVNSCSMWQTSMNLILFVRCETSLVWCQL